MTFCEYFVGHFWLDDSCQKQLIRPGQFGAIGRVWFQFWVCIDACAVFHVTLGQNRPCSSYKFLLEDRSLQEECTLNTLQKNKRPWNKSTSKHILLVVTERHLHLKEKVSWQKAEDKLKTFITFLFVLGDSGEPYFPRTSRISWSGECHNVNTKYFQCSKLFFLSCTMADRTTKLDFFFLCTPRRIIWSWLQSCLSLIRPDRKSVV